MVEPGRLAIGTWSGGRFMRFGEEIDRERLITLLTPGDGIDTILTADTYGQGAADSLLGEAISGLRRETFSLVGAVGHDFYEGERQGAKGFPRFTDPALRGPGEYGSYLRMACERSLERLDVERFDLLLLHNPDRTGYESEAVWEAMAALRAEGLTDLIGVAPGPANGFTLDLIRCLERFGSTIDWAMVILGPLEPWPGGLVLEAARRNDVRVITRVVDYGGLLWGDLTPATPLAEHDHRAFRPAGWVEAGLERIEGLRPMARELGLTPLQLACQWNLAQPAVECVVPTLIQELGSGARAIEDKRRELAATPSERLLPAEQLEEIRRLGDNTGSMALKGASPEHEGPELPDRWPMAPALAEAAKRHGIDPERDLRKLSAA